MVWFKRFSDPIILPDGRELLTPRDAAEYITALPKAEHDAADWQVAMEVLSLVAGAEPAQRCDTSAATETGPWRTVGVVGRIR